MASQNEPYSARDDDALSVHILRTLGGPALRRLAGLVRRVEGLPEVHLTDGRERARGRRSGPEDDDLLQEFKAHLLDEERARRLVEVLGGVCTLVTQTGAGVAGDDHNPPGGGERPPRCNRLRAALLTTLHRWLTGKTRNTPGRRLYKAVQRCLDDDIFELSNDMVRLADPGALPAGPACIVTEDNIADAAEDLSPPGEPERVPAPGPLREYIRALLGRLRGRVAVAHLRNHLARRLCLESITHIPLDDASMDTPGHLDADRLCARPDQDELLRSALVRTIDDLTERQVQVLWTVLTHEPTADGEPDPWTLLGMGRTAYYEERAVVRRKLREALEMWSWAIRAAGPPGPAKR